jgi:hypothetical protein
MIIDLNTALDTIWEALGAYRKGLIPEGYSSNYDDTWNDVCTAMAHIEEALGLESGGSKEHIHMQRYGESFGGLMPVSCGEYVLYDDAMAEIERLRSIADILTSELLVALNAPCGYPECLDEDERCERWLSGECVGPTARGE